MGREQGVKTMATEWDTAERADFVVLCALVRRKADRKIGRPSPIWVDEAIAVAERENNPVLEWVDPWPT